MELSELENVYQYKHEQEKIILNDPMKVFEQTKDLRNWIKEGFVVFYLNTDLSVISREIISIGTLNSCIIHPREIFRTAIARNSNSIIVAHNHPAGNTDPSTEDLKIKTQIKKAGEILQIPLLDHVIVSKQGYNSIKDNKENFPL
ncbi:MAG: DNA repair protein RadC [Desulfobacula sp.]|uniref:JAB domain-containing protein n=1 Tax=Desulfobacula sp. TaxID=2593537 RepID=UPI001D663D6E|nr:DNA repair protein RadC [Desulfobacula sp.]